MIKKFVDRFMAKKDELRDYFYENEPKEYKDIVKAVVKIINEGRAHGEPDHENIHEIDDGDYQGTLLYIIPVNTYQPSRYWSVFVDYGSCSGCDTLESIHVDGDKKQRIDDYMTLALHIVQGLKEIQNDS